MSSCHATFYRTGNTRKEPVFRSFYRCTFEDALVLDESAGEHVPEVDARLRHRLLVGGEVAARRGRRGQVAAGVQLLLVHGLDAAAHVARHVGHQRRRRRRRQLVQQLVQLVVVGQAQRLRSNPSFAMTSITSLSDWSISLIVKIESECCNFLVYLPVIRSMD